MRERRDKGDLEVKQKFQRYTSTYLYNALYLFSTKNIINKLIKKLENILYSENKSIIVRQKKIKLNKKDRLANAIILYRYYINYLQK